MKNNLIPATINTETSEIFYDQTRFNKSQSPETPMEPSQSKSAMQLTTILCAIWPQNNSYASPFYFLKNEFGTTYCVTRGVFYFFESQEFKEEMKRYAIENLKLDVKNSVIDDVLLILRTNPQIWNQVAEGISAPAVRVINQGDFYVGYALHPDVIISLTSNPPIHPQAVKISKTAKWQKNLYDHDTFAINSLSQITRSPRAYVTNITALFHQLGIPETQILLLISTLIHSIIGKKHLLTQITGSDERHKDLVFSCIANLIDPMTEKTKPIPKRSEQIKLQGIDEYFLSYKHFGNNKLKDEQQSTILEIMDGTAVVDATPKGKHQSLCRPKGPVLLQASDTAISHPGLQKRTLTIELSSRDLKIPEAIDQNVNENSRLELLRLTLLVAQSIYPMSHAYFNLPYKLILKEFEDMKDLIHIGCALSQLFDGSPDRFISEFTEWATEDLFTQLDDNDTAYLFYLWAGEHKDDSLTQPMKDWKDELEYHAELEQINLSSISERKLGADLKQAIPLLRKLGIDCKSSGRSKRLSSWTITVDKEIGLGKAISVQQCDPTGLPISNY